MQPIFFLMGRSEVKIAEAVVEVVNLVLIIRNLEGLSTNWLHLKTLIRLAA